MKVQIALERTSEGRPNSIQIYVDQITAALAAAGVTFVERPYEDTGTAPGVDLVWAPGMGNRRVPRVFFHASVPTVATIHGLQHIADPPMVRELGLRKAFGLYLWLARVRRDWFRLRHRVSGVIAVSEVLKLQIADRLHIPGAKIAVIAHGVPASFFVPPAEQARTRGDYLLHVSQYSAVKNVPRMVEAYGRVRDRIGLPFRIIAAGYPDATSGLPEGCEIVTTGVPHAEVRRLMRGAHLFVFPSLEESFGLPVLEAMASGVPVVTSRGTGAGEVADKAALLVDPTDTGAIADAMLRAATDEGLRARMRDDGLARAHDFTWDRSAKAHLALFERLVSGA